MAAELNRIEKEKAFHDQRFGSEEDVRNAVAKYYSINDRTRERYMEIIAAHAKGRRLLEYGCGAGESSICLLKTGAILSGIDISSEGINKAKEFISKSRFDADFFVMDCERMDFADSNFDLIVGAGILHHLDLSKAYKELSRVLNPEGRAIFLEPMGHNPLINLFRRLTPKMRTEDEHPFKVADLKKLYEYFKIVETEYYSLFTLLAVPLRNSRYFESILTKLESVDRLVFKIPHLRRFAWTVLIHAQKPH